MDFHGVPRRSASSNVELQDRAGIHHGLRRGVHAQRAWTGMVLDELRPRPAGRQRQVYHYAIPAAGGLLRISAASRRATLTHLLQGPDAATPRDGHRLPGCRTCRMERTVTILTDAAGRVRSSAPAADVASVTRTTTHGDWRTWRRSSAPPAGTYTVPAEMPVDTGADVGVSAGTYQVTVIISSSDTRRTRSAVRSLIRPSAETPDTVRARQHDTDRNS